MKAPGIKKDQQQKKNPFNPKPQLLNKNSADEISLDDFDDEVESVDTPKSQHREMKDFLNISSSGAARAV